MSGKTVKKKMAASFLVYIWVNIIRIRTFLIVAEVTILLVLLVR